MLCAPNPTAIPTTPSPATAGPMSMPSWPSTISPAITRMKNCSALPSRPSSVVIRLLISTELSSWAVPSVASRSSSVLTTPCTNRRASRIAMSAPTMMIRTGTSSSRAVASHSLQGFAVRSGTAGSRGGRRGRRVGDADALRRDELDALGGERRDHLLAELPVEPPPLGRAAPCRGRGAGPPTDPPRRRATSAAPPARRGRPWGRPRTPARRHR